MKQSMFLHFILVFCTLFFSSNIFGEQDYSFSEIDYDTYIEDCDSVQFSNDKFIQEYLTKWQNSREYLLEIINMMPEEKMNFKPMTDSKSFSETIIHMVGNMVWLSTDFLDGAGFESGYKDKSLNKKELVDLVNKAFDYSSMQVKNLDLSSLYDVTEFFAGPLTKMQILQLMDDHLSHHRGQLTVYLKLNDVQIPKYRGW